MAFKKKQKKELKQEESKPLSVEDDETILVVQSSVEEQEDVKIEKIIDDKPADEDEYIAIRDLTPVYSKDAKVPCSVVGKWKSMGFKIHLMVRKI